MDVNSTPLSPHPPSSVVNLPTADAIEADAKDIETLKKYLSQLQAKLASLESYYASTKGHSYLRNDQIQNIVSEIASVEAQIVNARKIPVWKEEIMKRRQQLQQGSRAKIRNHPATSPSSQQDPITESVVDGIMRLIKACSTASQSPTRFLYDPLRCGLVDPDAVIINNSTTASLLSTAKINSEHSTSTRHAENSQSVKNNCPAPPSRNSPSSKDSAPPPTISQIFGAPDFSGDYDSFAALGDDLCVFGKDDVEVVTYIINTLADPIITIRVVTHSECPLQLVRPVLTGSTARVLDALRSDHDATSLLFYRCINCADEETLGFLCKIIGRAAVFRAFAASAGDLVSSLAAAHHPRRQSVFFKKPVILSAAEAVSERIAVLSSAATARYEHPIFSIKLGNKATFTDTTSMINGNDARLNQRRSTVVGGGKEYVSQSTNTAPFLFAIRCLYFGLAGPLKSIYASESLRIEPLRNYQHGLSRAGENTTKKPNTALDISVTPMCGPAENDTKAALAAARATSIPVPPCAKFAKFNQIKAITDKLLYVHNHFSECVPQLPPRAFHLPIHLLNVHRIHEIKSAYEREMRCLYRIHPHVEDVEFCKQDCASVASQINGNDGEEAIIPSCQTCSTVTANKCEWAMGVRPNPLVRLTMAQLRGDLKLNATREEARKFLENDENRRESIMYDLGEHLGGGGKNEVRKANAGKKKMCKETSSSQGNNIGLSHDVDLGTEWNLFKNSHLDLNRSIIEEMYIIDKNIRQINKSDRAKPLITPLKPEERPDAYLYSQYEQSILSFFCESKTFQETTRPGNFHTTGSNQSSRLHSPLSSPTTKKFVAGDDVGLGFSAAEWSLDATKGTIGDFDSTSPNSNFDSKRSSSDDEEIDHEKENGADHSQKYQDLADIICDEKDGKRVSVFSCVDEALMVEMFSGPKLQLIPSCFDENVDFDETMSQSSIAELNLTSEHERRELFERMSEGNCLDDDLIGQDAKIRGNNKKKRADENTPAFVNDGKSIYVRHLARKPPPPTPPPPPLPAETQVKNHKSHTRRNVAPPPPPTPAELAAQLQTAKKSVASSLNITPLAVDVAMRVASSVQSSAGASQRRANPKPEKNPFPISAFCDTPLLVGKHYYRAAIPINLITHCLPTSAQSIPNEHCASQSVPIGENGENNNESSSQREIHLDRHQIVRIGWCFGEPCAEGGRTVDEAAENLSTTEKSSLRHPYVLGNDAHGFGIAIVPVETVACWIEDKMPFSEKLFSKSPQSTAVRGRKRGLRPEEDMKEKQKTAVEVISRNPLNAEGFKIPRPPLPPSNNAAESEVFLTVEESQSQPEETAENANTACKNTTVAAATVYASNGLLNTASSSFFDSSISCKSGFSHDAQPTSIPPPSPAKKTHHKFVILKCCNGSFQHYHTDPTICVIEVPIEDTHIHVACGIDLTDQTASFQIQNYFLGTAFVNLPSTLTVNGFCGFHAAITVPQPFEDLYSKEVAAGKGTMSVVSFAFSSHDVLDFFEHSNRKAQSPNESFDSAEDPSLPTETARNSTDDKQRKAKREAFSCVFENSCGECTQDEFHHTNHSRTLSSNCSRNAAPYEAITNQEKLLYQLSSLLTFAIRIHNIANNIVDETNIQGQLVPLKKQLEILLAANIKPLFNELETIPVHRIPVIPDIDAISDELQSESASESGKRNFFNSGAMVFHQKLVRSGGTTFSPEGPKNALGAATHSSIFRRSCVGARHSDSLDDVAIDISFLMNATYSSEGPKSASKALFLTPAESSNDDFLNTLRDSSLYFARGEQNHFSVYGAMALSYIRRIQPLLVQAASRSSSPTTAKAADSKEELYPLQIDFQSLANFPPDVRATLITIRNRSIKAPPLCAALHLNQYHVVEILTGFRAPRNEHDQIARNVGININVADEQGNTPLILAVLKGKPLLVQHFLCNLDASVAPVNYQGYNAVHIAMLCGQHECLEILMSHPTAVNEEIINTLTPYKSNCVLIATKLQSKELLVEFLKRGGDPSKCDVFNVNALLFSLKNGIRRDMTEEILKYDHFFGSVEVNQRERIDEKGTPLLLAAALGWTHVCELLSSRGASVYATFDHNRCSVLHAAICSDDDECAQHILIHAIRQNEERFREASMSMPHISLASYVNAVENKYGATALHLACERGLTQTVKLLIALPETDVNKQTKNGQTALMLAALGATDDLACMIIRQRRSGVLNANSSIISSPSTIQFDLCDRSGNNALIYAAQKGHLQLLTLLVDQCRVELNSVNNAGHTALTAAIMNGKISCAEMILRLGGHRVKLTKEKGSSVPAASEYAFNKGFPVFAKLLASMTPPGVLTNTFLAKIAKPMPPEGQDKNASVSPSANLDLAIAPVISEPFRCTRAFYPEGASSYIPFGLSTTNCPLKWLEARVSSCNGAVNSVHPVVSDPPPLFFDVPYPMGVAFDGAKNNDGYSSAETFLIDLLDHTETGMDALQILERLENVDFENITISQAADTSQLFIPKTLPIETLCENVLKIFQSRNPFATSKPFHAIITTTLRTVRHLMVLTAATAHSPLSHLSYEWSLPRANAKCIHILLKLLNTQSKCVSEAEYVSSFERTMNNIQSEIVGSREFNANAQTTSKWPGRNVSLMHIAIFLNIPSIVSLLIHHGAVPTVDINPSASTLIAFSFVYPQRSANVQSTSEHSTPHQSTFPKRQCIHVHIPCALACAFLLSGSLLSPPPSRCERQSGDLVTEIVWKWYKSATEIPHQIHIGNSPLCTALQLSVVSTNCVNECEAFNPAGEIVKGESLHAFFIAITNCDISCTLLFDMVQHMMMSNACESSEKTPVETALWVAICLNRFDFVQLFLRKGVISDGELNSLLRLANIMLDVSPLSLLCLMSYSSLSVESASSIVISFSAHSDSLRSQMRGQEFAPRQFSRQWLQRAHQNRAIRGIQCLQHTQSGNTLSERSINIVSTFLAAWRKKPSPILATYVIENVMLRIAINAAMTLSENKAFQEAHFDALCRTSLEKSKESIDKVNLTTRIPILEIMIADGHSKQKVTSSTIHKLVLCLKSCTLGCESFPLIIKVLQLIPQQTIRCLVFEIISARAHPFVCAKVASLIPNWAMLTLPQSVAEEVACLNAKIAVPRRKSSPKQAAVHCEAENLSFDIELPGEALIFLWNAVLHSLLIGPSRGRPCFKRINWNALFTLSAPMYIPAILSQIAGRKQYNSIAVEIAKQVAHTQLTKFQSNSSHPRRHLRANKNFDDPAIPDLHILSFNHHPKHDPLFLVNARGCDVWEHPVETFDVMQERKHVPLFTWSVDNVASKMIAAVSESMVFISGGNCLHQSKQTVDAGGQQNVAYDAPLNFSNWIDGVLLIMSRCGFVDGILAFRQALLSSLGSTTFPSATLKYICNPASLRVSCVNRNPESTWLFIGNAMAERQILLVQSTNASFADFCLESIISQHDVEMASVEIKLLLQTRFPLSLAAVEFAEEQRNLIGINFITPVHNDSLLHICSMHGSETLIETLLADDRFNMASSMNACGFKAWDYATSPSVIDMLVKGGLLCANRQYKARKTKQIVSIAKSVIEKLHLENLLEANGRSTQIITDLEKLRYELGKAENPNLYDRLANKSVFDILHLLVEDSVQDKSFASGLLSKILEECNEQKSNNDFNTLVTPDASGNPLVRFELAVFSARYVQEFGEAALPKLRADDCHKNELFDDGSMNSAVTILKNAGLIVEVEDAFGTIGIHSDSPVIGKIAAPAQISFQHLSKCLNKSGSKHPPNVQKKTVWDCRFLLEWERHPISGITETIIRETLKPTFTIKTLSEVLELDCRSHDGKTIAVTPIYLTKQPQIFSVQSGLQSFDSANQRQNSE